MKHARTVSCLLLIAILCTIFCVPAYADVEETETTYLPDGSYYVTTIRTLSTDIAPYGAVKRISGEKNRERYDANGKLVWTLTVTGSFTYDGKTAEAIDADYSYAVYDTSWAFVSGSATCFDATAQASGTFRQGALTRQTTTVSLVCSADGTLS